MEWYYYYYYYYYSTHASVVLFEGRDCLHSTLPWSGNRCVIIAYTIGQYKSMEKEHQTYLETAGFRLPDLLAPDGRLEAPAGQPSATYAVQQRLRFGPAEGAVGLLLWVANAVNP